MQPGQGPLRSGFRQVFCLVAVATVFAGCGEPEATSAGEASTPLDEAGTGKVEVAGVDELYPDVIDASATLDPDGTWTFSVTLSSPYDSAERYADAWRVIGADGTVYGVRELTHDHAGEQPFTRRQSGIAIPDGVDSVLIEGRDQVSGWGGETTTVVLSR